MANAAYKTPAEIKDYTIDWSQALAEGEQINTSAWTISNSNGDVALTITDPAPTDTSTTATVWLKGGTPGQVYILTNTITTDNNPARELQESFPCYVNAENSL